MSSSGAEMTCSDTAPARTMFATLERMLPQRGSTIGNALSLFGTTVVTSGFGFAFWVGAARLFSASEIGLAGAAISAMQLLAMASMLGLGTLLIGELARGRVPAQQLLATALTASIAAGALSGLAYAVISAFASLRGIPAGPFAAMLFAVTVAVSAALLVLDDATVGLSRASWQLWRNSAFSVLKLTLLPVAYLIFRNHGSVALLVSWLGGALGSLVLVSAFARRASVRLLARPRPHLCRHLGRTALIHHCLNLSSGAPRLVLPVLVASFLPPSVSASFYAALMLVGFAYVVPSHLSTALFAIASGDETGLMRELRRTMRISVIVAVGAVMVFGLGGRFLLAIFGHSYTGAAGALGVLGTGTFVSGVKSHYISVCRVRGDLTRCAALSCFGSVLEIAFPCLCLVGGGGLMLASLAWVLAMTGEAVAFWPAVAAAGSLPGQLPGRLRWIARWSAPHTLAEPASLR